MSTIPFQPLVKSLTSLLDDFADNHEVIYREDGQPEPGNPTMGERLFIYHVYDYLSRSDSPLTVGFAHLLQRLTRGTHDRLTYFEVRPGVGVHTDQQQGVRTHRFQRIAHLLMELEKFNSAIREANGVKAKEQIVLNMCPECGAVTIGTRYQPSLLCSASCRVAKSRADYLKDVNVRKPEGLKTAIEFSKWLARCHRDTVFDQILLYDNRLPVVFEDEFLQIEDDAIRAAEYLANYTALDVNHLAENDIEKSFTQFDISLKQSSGMPQRPSSEESGMARLKSKLLEQYSYGEAAYYGETAMELREQIQDLDPDDPMGYPNFNIELAEAETRTRRIGSNKGNSLIRLQYLPDPEDENEKCWQAVGRSGNATIKPAVEAADLQEGASEPMSFSLQYRVKSTGYIVPGVLDLYQFVKDTNEMVGGDWAEACISVASRLEVLKVKSVPGGASKVLGHLIEPDHPDRDKKIGFHIMDVTASVTNRILKQLEAERVAQASMLEADSARLAKLLEKQLAERSKRSE